MSRRSEAIMLWRVERLGPRGDGPGQRSAENADPLGALLVESGVVAEVEIDRALAAQKDGGGQLGEILLQRGLISRPLLDRTLARQAGVVLEAEHGFGSGLRALIERRHLEKAGVHTQPVDLDGALREAVGPEALLPPKERRCRDRRTQPDRRTAGGREQVVYLPGRDGEPLPGG